MQPSEKLRISRLIASSSQPQSPVAADATPDPLAGILNDLAETNFREKVDSNTEGREIEALGDVWLKKGADVRLDEETKERFRLLVNGVVDHALLTYDCFGVITSWNRGVERLLGYSEADILGKHFSLLFTPEDVAEGIPEMLMGRAAELGCAEDEGWRVRANGERFWAFVSKTAICNEAGKIRGFAVVIHDRTEKKKASLALEEARQERSRLRLQEIFLSNVSHELRTPLTAIYFFISNLAEGVLGELAPAQQDHVMLALENIEQLREMVADLLDITRVDNRKLLVTPRLADPAKMVAAIMNTCLTAASAKAITLRSDIEPGVPLVWADPLRVGQVLANLIGNAIKFTPAGGEIAVDAKLCSDDGQFVRFSVRDNGCGIAVENHALIFERLAQIKSGEEVGRSGLGLGLFIAKGLVEDQGGAISVESQPGCGSTFSFTLPISLIARKCAPLLTRQNLASGSVTLIALDIVFQSSTEAELQEISGLVERCVHPFKDVVLHWMDGVAPTKSLFIIAFTDVAGSMIISHRIRAELKDKCGIEVRPSSVSVRHLRIPTDAPDGKEAAEVIERLTRLIQAHLIEEEELS